MIVKNIKLEKISFLKESDSNYGKEDFYDDDYNRYGEGEEDVDEEDHLCYLIRSFLNGNGIVSTVERHKLDLAVYVFLQRKERFKSLLRVFDVVINKMKRDILPQYELEMELFETKEDGMPVLSFSFFYAGTKEDEEDEDIFK